MIPIDLFDNCKSRLDNKIIRYVNDNLKVMVEVYRDYLNADDGFDVEEKLLEVLPRDYVIRNSKECRNMVDELYEMISSPVIRDYVKPKYEYLLYHIMSVWMETRDDEESCIPIKLSTELRKEIEDCDDYITEEDGGNYILKKLEDFDSYLYFCFLDHDFLPDSLERMVTLYLRTPTILEIMFPDVDLDNYVDLMPVDLRELYIEKNQKEIHLEEIFSHSTNLEYEIISELHSAISLLQNHSIEWFSKGEVEISNEIYRMVKRVFKRSLNLEIEREALIGRAKVYLGETDFAIYINNNKHYKNIAIIESKFIDRFIQEYGQLLGYLNPSFRFGITLSINKEKTLDEAMQYITNKLNGIKDNDFKVIEITQNPFGDEFNYIIKSEHTLPEDSSRTMALYHLIINLYDIDRRRIAEESRKR